MAEAVPLRPTPAVRLAADTLRIDALTVTDQAVIAYASELEEPELERFVLDALSVGARVLEREHAGAQADHVRVELERATENAERVLSDRTRTLPDQLATQLARHFDDESSAAVQHRVRALVQQALADSGGQVAQALAELRAEVRAERDLRAAVASERERSAGKGRVFEELLAERLQLIAAAQGDSCEHVGDEQSAGGKVGDVIVEIDAARGPSRGRIVFEAKHRQLSKPAALAELDSTRDCRDADYAVLVASSTDRLPARTHPLREYGGDKLLCAYDPDEPASEQMLAAAYSIARARVTLASTDANVLDSAAVRVAIERIVGALDDAREVKHSLTGANRAIENARTGVETIVSHVRGHVTDLQALLDTAHE